MKATQDAAERWLPVVGFEERYEVSNQGRIRSLGLWVNNRFYPPAFKKLSMDAHVRLAVELWCHARRSRRIVAVVVAAAFVGPRPDGMEVCHNNGDPTDNRPENLRYDTHLGNMRDQLRHGTNANANKTHCPRGHEYTPENTKLYRGSRFCRTCKRDYDARRARRLNRREDGTLVPSA